MWTISITQSQILRCALSKYTYRNLLKPLKSGMIPQLIKTLTQHATLAQEALDTSIKHAALVHLSNCRQQLNELTTLIQQGKLPEAVSAGETVDKLLENPPALLETTQIMHDLRVSLLQYLCPNHN